MTRDIKDCECECDMLIKLNKELEQRIAELTAPKTCEGCEYYNNRYPYCDHVAECSRFPTLFDYYEPKDQK